MFYEGTTTFKGAQLTTNVHFVLFVQCVQCEGLLLFVHCLIENAFLFWRLLICNGHYDTLIKQALSLNSKFNFLFFYLLLLKKNKDGETGK